MGKGERNRSHKKKAKHTRHESNRSEKGSKGPKGKKRPSELEKNSKGENGGLDPPDAKQPRVSTEETLLENGEKTTDDNSVETVGESVNNNATIATAEIHAGEDDRTVNDSKNKPRPRTRSKPGDSPLMRPGEFNRGNPVGVKRAKRAILNTSNVVVPINDGPPIQQESENANVPSIQQESENANVPPSAGDGIQTEVENQASSDDSEMDTSSSSSSSESDSDSTSSSSDSDRDRGRYRRGKKKRGKRSRSSRTYRTHRSEKSSKKNGKDATRMMEKNPDLMQMVQNLVDQRLSAMKKDKGGKITPVNQVKNKNKDCPPLAQRLKSPSDTTVYAPALRRLTATPLELNFNNRQSPENQIAKGMQQLRVQNTTNDVDVVEQSESDESESEAEIQPPVDAHKQLTEEARRAAEEAVLQAEKFKADATAINKGNALTQGTYDYRLDDEFLHVTCHLEDSITIKIKRGEFIELEKLLNKAMNPLRQDCEGKMDLVNKDGHSYFVPSSDKEYKINNVKMWEKAFRIYVMIYTEENPARAPELLQYIDVIQEAAQTFTWANVAQYDYSFRKLMHKYPQRSWGRIHTQLWSTTLKNHLQPGRSAQGAGSSSGKQNWREISCWRYNKGKCNKSAAQCRFEHRCSFCGAFSHVYHNCPKRPGRKPNQDQKRGVSNQSGQAGQSVNTTANQN